MEKTAIIIVYNKIYFFCTKIPSKMDIKKRCAAEKATEEKLSDCDRKDDDKNSLGKCKTFRCESM